MLRIKLKKKDKKTDTSQPKLACQTWYLNLETEITS
jgi:hypothetical protein